MTFGEEILSVGINFILLLELFCFLFVGKWAYDKVTEFSFHHELTDKDNLAFAITLLGYLAGIAIVLIGINSTEDFALKESQGIVSYLMLQIVDIAIYSTLAITLLLLSRVVSDRYILHGFSVYKEIIEDKNSGTGVVVFASFISTALIINASISGEGIGIISCLLFFIIGQVILILFAKLYQFITPFDIHDEIEKDNVAVGCSFAGTLIAIGILVSKGITGEFDGIGDLLSNLMLYTVIGFIIFPAIRVGFDKHFIPDVDLSEELVKDKNIGLGVLEGGLAIIVASAIYFGI